MYLIPSSVRDRLPYSDMIDSQNETDVRPPTFLWALGIATIK